MDKISNFIICATARSGSNLLCELLSALGFAGKPFEHLWEPPGSVSLPLAIRWPRIIEDGRSDNGVFGTKLLWYQGHRLERELPEAVGRPGETLVDVLADTLANPRYIYLTRRDRTKQAVSLVRAIQSEQWRSMDAAVSPPRYDAAAIDAARDAVAAEEAQWEQFFTHNTVVLRRLTYEDLDAHPRATIGALLQFLGHEGPLPDTLSSTEHRKQADAVTDEWVRRYEREDA